MKEKKSKRRKIKQKEDRMQKLIRRERTIKGIQGVGERNSIKERDYLPPSGIYCLRGRFVTSSSV